MGKSLTGIRLAAVLLLSLPLLASAAGLGRLTVLSALGQPLNAEIEIVSLQAGEEESLAVRLAPIEAFRQAAIEFNSALVGMRLAIDKRAGKPVVRLTSSQPFQEPFIDLLVELSWTAGRLVREYTFLLDPPEYKAPPRVAPPPVAVVPAPAPIARPEPPRRIEERPIVAPAPAPAAPRAAAPAAPRAAAPKAAGTVEVKKGDTLGKIAAANKPDGVTVQQMLVALYRANRDAFIRDNINLVRAGRILNVPDRDEVASVDQQEARRLVTSQHADWNEYRRSLGAAVAETPASAAPGQQTTRGRITAQPDAPKTGETRDQLKLSKADPSAKAGSAARAAREDDTVARAKALKEAESRISDLEKNVTDLNKLVEMKNQQLAQIERQGGKPAASTPAAKAPEPAKPAVEIVKPAPPAAVPAVPAPEPAKPAADAAAKASSEPAKPTAVPAIPAAEPFKPSPVAKDAVLAKPKAAALPPPPPPPEPSLLDEFLDNPIALGGLVAIVLLLAGYALWAWRRKKAAESRFADSVLGGTSGLGSASVFSEPGPEPVIVGAPGVQTAATQPALAESESDNVDPIAEADVYMAYGRDAQAEEILKEALAKSPGRTALQLKLLEVYAARKDGRSFEQLLMKLKEGTGGHGPEWTKAIALGHGLDPQNPLYGGGGSPIGADQTVRITAADQTVRITAVPAPSVDFDIGSGTAAETAGTVDMEIDSVATPSAPASSVDFDLSGDTVAPAGRSDFAPTGTLIMDQKEVTAASSGLDFDLGGDDAAPTAQSAHAPAEPSGGLDFDLNLDLDAPAAPAPEPAPDVDLGSISLDLGTPGEGGAVPDAKWQEVATKLDLAKAYEEMGDKDGARALLQEVAKDGDAAQRKQADQMLSGLG